MNPLSPDRMTTPERLNEVARILATGILRARSRGEAENPYNIKRIGDIPLDFTAPQRGHVVTKQRRGETR